MVNERPTVYKMSSVYKEGGAVPIALPPSGITYLQYFNKASGSGYLTFNSWDDFIIDKEDIIYFTFEIDMSLQNYHFMIIEGSGGGGGTLEFEPNNNHIDQDGTMSFRGWNMSNRSDTSYITIPVGNRLWSFKRTFNGWFNDVINLTQTPNKPFAKVSRILNGNASTLKFYKQIVTDKNNIIKFEVIPAKRNNNIGVYCPQLDSFLEPTSQSGFSAGPEVWY